MGKFQNLFIVKGVKWEPFVIELKGPLSIKGNRLKIRVILPMNLMGQHPKHFINYFQNDEEVARLWRHIWGVVAPFPGTPQSSQPMMWLHDSESKFRPNIFTH